MQISSNVRVGRSSYDALESARDTDLRKDKDRVSVPGLEGGAVYVPSDQALGRQVGLDDWTLQLGRLILVTELGHLPSSGHAAVIAASPDYRQYGVQSLLAPLRGRMDAAAQQQWWQDLASAVAQGERSGLPPQLVAPSVTPAVWQRGATRLVQHGDEWFVVLTFEVPQVRRQAQRREGTGIDLGLANLATVATARRVDVVPRGASPLVRHRPEGLVLSTVHRALYDSLQYSAARAELDALTDRLAAGAWFVAVERLKPASFQSDFPVQARRLAVLDWLWSHLPQTLHLQGIPLLRVYPAYSSQQCHRCRSRQLGQRQERLFRCAQCGLAMDADENAALVLLGRGYGVMRQRRRT